MMLLRPVARTDLPALMHLAAHTGGGMTSLPPDQAALEARIARSVDSFAKSVSEPGPEYYLMVLEKDGAVVGTTGVYATVGLEEPFYSYRVLHLTQVSRSLDKKVHTRLLQLVNDFAGATELGSLFLAAEHRGGGAGMLLSKARYLLIAAHRARFADRIMAEIRGWVDETGRSPFWEAVGRHFFGMDFQGADHINAMGNQQFIADLMPKFPLYTALLPSDAQATIAKPRDEAQPAIRLLEDEGLRYAGAVDIFDGGPSYVAQVDQVCTIAAARPVTAQLGGPEQGIRVMVGCMQLDNLRIIQAEVPEGADIITLSEEQWRALGLRDGPASLWTAPLKVWSKKP